MSVEPHGAGFIDHKTKQDILQMKMAGLSYATLAEKFGISKPRVAQICKEMMMPVRQELTDQLRAQENERLDIAQARIWRKVLDGDLDAIKTFLLISQRRARMNGLDMPTKVELSVDVRREMEQALASLETVVLGEVVSGAVPELGAAAPEDE